MKALRPWLQFLLPIGLLAGGGFAAYRIASKPPQAKVEAPPAAGPLVRVALAKSIDARVDVVTQGAIEPLRLVELAAQVSGRITATDPALRTGGVFAANTALVTIDGADYEFAVVQQQAAVARAELRVLQEKAEAEAAVRAWRELEGDRAADPLVTRGPQIRDADAALAAAHASLARSRLDLERTRVTVPFAGRVQRVAADLGQTVQAGQRLATLFDLSAVEVRLPIALADTAFVDLPLHAPGDDESGPQVTLQAEFGGATHEWTAHLVRIEGEVDRKSRQLIAVARCRPERNGDTARPPLLVGMFVQARIAGRTFPGTIELPHAALPNGSVVWLVDAESRLRARPVTVLRRERDRVLVAGGLTTGERVIVSELPTASDGMVVRVAPTPGGAEDK